MEYKLKVDLVKRTLASTTTAGMKKTDELCPSAVAGLKLHRCRTVENSAISCISSGNRVLISTERNCTCVLTEASLYWG